MLDIDSQVHLAAAARCKAIPDTGEIARDQGEQVRRLGERINPAHPVPTIIPFSGIHGVSVGQQDRIALSVGDDRDVIPRHNIRPVGKIRDLAEAFRLALCQKKIARGVKSLQGGIVLRPDEHFDVQPAGPADAMNGQQVGCAAEFAVLKRFPIALQGDQLHALAVEHDVLFAILERRFEFET